MTNLIRLLDKLLKGVEVPEAFAHAAYKEHPSYEGVGDIVYYHPNAKPANCIDLFTRDQLLAYGAAQRLAGREQDKADAERYRWLTDDHADAEMRDRVEDIGIRLRWIGKGAADATIDAAMLAASPQEQT